MVAKSYLRGWEIIFVDGYWVYADNYKLINKERRCKRCGKMPTKEGYDACLGKIEGASSACCGHGIENPYTVMKKDG